MSTWTGVAAGIATGTVIEICHCVVSQRRRDEWRRVAATGRELRHVLTSVIADIRQARRARP